MTHPISTYLDNLKKKFTTGVATEHTYRGALAGLFEALDESVRAINEPSRVACGAPDLVILHGDLKVGHVEAKDIGASLDMAENSDQLKRYRLALENLILTDYLEFRWYMDGNPRQSVRLAKPDQRGQLQLEPDCRKNLEELLNDFLAHQPQPISTPRELDERMARLTHLIRDVIVNAFKNERASELLKGWRRAFAQVLIPDLDQPENLGQFADMFAQTLSYGLFSARIMHQAGEFHRYTAKYAIPRTNPFLRDFFSYITGPQLSDEPYAGFVDDLIQVLANADMHAILADFGRTTRQDDPMMHFYETFLAAYDPKLKEKRGVYFTPMPVVSFIVRSVDELLKTRREKAFQSLIDPDYPDFFVLENIQEKIFAFCRNTGQHVPEGIGEIARCIFESLALKYRFCVENLEKILGKNLRNLYIVGGGSKNKLLNQFTANALGKRVIAGPVESATMGNLLSQAIAMGELKDINDLRQVVRNSVNLQVYQPKETQVWDDVYGRFIELIARD